MLLSKHLTDDTSHRAGKGQLSGGSIVRGKKEMKFKFIFCIHD